MLLNNNAQQNGWIIYKSTFPPHSPLFTYPCLYFDIFRVLCSSVAETKILRIDHWNGIWNSDFISSASHINQNFYDNPHRVIGATEPNTGCHRLIPSDAPRHLRLYKVRNCHFLKSQSLPAEGKEVATQSGDYFFDAQKNMMVMLISLLESSEKGRSFGRGFARGFLRF